MKIFVAGGAGFIGSNFIRHILGRHQDARILNYDKLTDAGNLDNLRDIESDQRYSFVKGDIVDKGFLFQTLNDFNPDYIINFAAETHVDRSIHVGPQEFISTNIWGVFNLLEYTRQGSIKKYLQVSTDEVYGSLPLGSEDKLAETAIPAPRNPYSATKASGDLLALAYYSSWKTPVVVTRSSNTFGPYQYPEKLIPFFVVRALEGKTLPLYGTGENVRSWIYVIDHCQAIDFCLFHGRPGEIYNIGADSERSNLEIALMILEYFSKDKSHIEFVTDRPGHDLRYALDTTKIRTELGWQPGFAFEDAFHKTIKWYVDNAAWIDAARRRAGYFNPHIDFGKRVS